MLKINHNYLTAIIEATPNAIYIKDEAGKYLMINKMGAAAIGLEVEDFIGKDDSEILPPDVAAEVMKLDRMVFAGTPHNGEERVNDNLVFHSHKFILQDKDNGERVLAGISTDISDQIKARVELEKARERAEEANKHKSVFLQNMSHELRTPLNAIIGFSSILSGESGVAPAPDDENFKEYAKLINTSGIHLLAIINDLLDLSKIEAGEQDFVEGEIDVGYVIETCIQTLSGLAKEKNISIKEQLPSKFITMKGDEKLLRQMTFNLLSNAIKYSTPDTKVTVRLRIRNSGGIDISIIDQGIGMSDEDLSTAMIPFRRASQVKNSEISGTGLGLPLVDAFVKLFDGSLNIKSEQGVGTTATLHFPQDRSVII